MKHIMKVKTIELLLNWTQIYFYYDFDIDFSVKPKNKANINWINDKTNNITKYYMISCFGYNNDYKWNQYLFEFCLDFNTKNIDKEYVIKSKE